MTKAGLKASALIIMKRIQDSNIFKEAFEEIYPDNEVESVLDKHAFDIHATPGALLGAITGAAIAEKKTREEILRKQIEQDNSEVLRGNYYTQVQNIVDKLKIIFTPFGVVYLVKNGTKEVTIETIQTEEMNASMYQAWQAKDYNYYKFLLLNKMLSEIQFVEQEFAKNVIKNQFDMQKNINKKASFDDVDTEDLTLPEITEYISRIKDAYSKHTGTTEKMAEILYNMINDNTEYVISWEFERPVQKYASLAQNLSFLGLSGSSDDIKSLQGHYLNPSYLQNRINVGFLPDRVLFMVDNKVIASLLTIKMNENAFKHFETHDREYFEKYFNEQAKLGVARMNGKAAPPMHIKDILEKKAAAVAPDLSEIFKRNDIHPGVYYVALNKKYGLEWMSYEQDPLMVIIEKDFNLTEGISDIPLNKILSIQVCNTSEMPYQSRHAFEKVIRSFSNKPIDFLKRETDDMNEVDIAFGIDIMDRITPYDDIYDNFSQDVFSHIVQILAQKDLRAYMPSAITGSEKEPEFNEAVNNALLKAINDIDILRIEDEAKEAKTIANNGFISSMSIDILNALKRQKQKLDAIDDERFVEIIIKKLHIEPIEIASVVKNQIMRNLKLDSILVSRENILKEQLKAFNLE